MFAKKGEKKMLFVCYEKCSTCKKAEKWLVENGFEFEKRDIKGENPTFEELKAWHEKSQKPLKSFFNTSGMIYRQMNLKEKLEKMTEEEQLRLLASDGMLVKRPLLIGEKTVLCGFNESKWSEALK